ncbi:T-cell surface glycoprotein CD8 alpha chain-like [Thalassophryne amazonica]|uniref:T-cell surface glycoprotein CD8 alpha chain-like n=1 Tax=Thalassophryne amazonica TaxID=390379 RepID=UPI001470C99C|nr:T-cell surface glycoprotein CD8 alpha chain-like [Thalassophryne amazonica]
MDQKWIQSLLILVFCQQMVSLSDEAKTIKEGQSADVRCSPGTQGAVVIWFRVLDVSGMQYIGSFTHTGFMKQMAPSLESVFKYDRVRENILTVNSFNKTRDSGLYCCASVVRNIELRFGPITRLVPEKVKATRHTPTAVTKLNLLTTRAACSCEDDKTTGAECSLVVLGPLAGGCGLLLLILIITIMYCNRIRTRRCPHHYKRKPRPNVPAK